MTPTGHRCRPVYKTRDCTSCSSSSSATACTKTSRTPGNMPTIEAQKAIPMSDTLCSLPNSGILCTELMLHCAFSRQVCGKMRFLILLTWLVWRRARPVFESSGPGRSKWSRVSAGQHRGRRCLLLVRALPLGHLAGILPTTACSILRAPNELCKWRCISLTISGSCWT